MISSDHSHPNQDFIDSLPVGVYGCGIDGRITFFNECAVAIWRRAPDLEKDRYCSTFRRFLLDGRELAADETPMAHVLRTGEAVLGKEAIVERPDGSKVVCRVHVRPIRDAGGRVTGAINVFMDVTDTHQLLDRLKQAENRSDEVFKALADAMPIMVWAIDRENEVFYVNKKTVESTGITMQSPDPESWITALYHPEDLASAYPVWQETIAKGNPFFGAFRMLSPGNQYRWHLVNSVPIPDGKGKIQRIGTATDIHDLVTAQEKLAKLKEEAESASRAKSTFLMTMSHEMRTPLTAILGYAELLRGKTRTAEEKDEFIDRIENSGRQLQRLIDDILDLSQVEAGRLVIERQWISPKDAVADTISSLQLQAKKKKVALQAKAGDDLPERIHTDPTRLRQILVNVTGNALKFTEKGSVTISIRKDAGAERVRFEIEDTGIGMDESDRQRLFLPFTQGDGSSTRRYGGSGIGLFLSKRLAEALDGDLYLQESEPDKGSLFVFSVPVNASSAPPPAAQDPSSAERPEAAPAPSDDPPLPGVRILLVEDLDDNRRLFKTVLETAGAMVTLASNGAEAVRLAEGEIYDVILMDLQMPVMDGFEATRRLRSSGCETPVIAITAHAMKEEVDRAREAGCDTHVSKPVTSKSLISAVRKILGGH